MRIISGIVGTKTLILRSGPKVRVSKDEAERPLGRMTEI